MMADSEFDFVRLPVNVFVKILQNLQWREIFRSRLVSKHWTQAANLTLAVETKSIDTSRDHRFRGMAIGDLERLLPIVSGGLESLTMRSGSGFGFGCTTINIDAIRDMAPFRALRVLELTNAWYSLETVLVFLDKSPNLKELRASIAAPLPKWLHESSGTGSTRKFGLEKLWLQCECGFTDPDLVCIPDYYPKLTSLTIESDTAFLTSSCVSFMASRFGDQLTHLQISEFYNPNRPLYSPFGVFDGIGACRNIVDLSLAGSHYVSNGFLAALSACINLTNLNLVNARELTNDGLAMLASLPSLKRLNISGADSNLSGAVIQIAHEGRIQELVTANAEISAACLKICVRYCSHLRLLDIRDNHADVTVEDALEIIRLYCRHGSSSVLGVRADVEVWGAEEVRIMKEEIGAETHRRVVINCHSHREGFLDEGVPESDEFAFDRMSAYSGSSYGGGCYGGVYLHDDEFDDDFYDDMMDYDGMDDDDDLDCECEDFVRDWFDPCNAGQHPAQDMCESEFEDEAEDADDEISG